MLGASAAASDWAQVAIAILLGLLTAYIGLSIRQKRRQEIAVRRASLLDAIRRRTEFSLKMHLLTQPGVVISDVPVLAKKHAEWKPPERAVCRVLVSGAHAATLRAVNYAGALGLEDTEQSSSPSTRKMPTACGPSGQAGA